MTHERDPRKRAILAAVSASKVSATVYMSRRKPFVEARSDILSAMMPGLITAGINRLTIEGIAGTDQRDRRDIRDVHQKLDKLDALH